MKRGFIHLFTVLCGLLLSLVSVRAQNATFTYQGKVTDHGTNFTGVGQFKFALVSGASTNSLTTYWSNDGTSVNGSQPSAAVNVAVSNGLFSVVLGDSTVPNMGTISASLFAQANLQLRIWFSDGVAGFAALDPPQPLTPAPYAVQALNASTASNLSGTLPASQLSGAVSLAQLPAAVVTNNQAGVVSSSPQITNPTLFGNTTGSFTMPVVSSNVVYTSPYLFDVYGAPETTNEELTGFYCDGTNNYYLFNPGRADIASNGFKFVVTDMNGELRAFNYGQAASNVTAVTGYNVACGLSYHAGHLYANICQISAPNFEADSNAVAVFETNGYGDGVFPLGGQPRILQNMTFLSNGTVAMVYLGGSNDTALFIADTYAATHFPVYNPTTWLTNGLDPIVAKTPIGTILGGIALSPVDHATLYVSTVTPPYTAFDAIENDIYAQFLYSISPDGSVTLVGYQHNPNGKGV